MKLLFADDEENIREVLTNELKAIGHDVTPCADGADAIAAMENEQFDVLLVDLDMPKIGGSEVIERAAELNANADVVILTGKASLETAIAAVRQGVTEYLTKPYKIFDLEIVLKRISAKREKDKHFLALSNQLKRAEGAQTLIGNSALMQHVHKMIDRIAVADATVVVLGETGTGKELVARAIHDRSSRHKKPFVAINCGALPESLIESELFGHKKGSFTGADTHRTGLLEVASGGTLFLDEIGELPKGVQAKFLRFLESGEVRRVGDNTATQCDVRVVCATLKNLELMVSEDRFREDLWFRINTFEIFLPPLRDRLDDMPDLVLHLARRFQPNIGIESGKELFTDAAWERMAEYDWPGNVRQLANTIEHALILSEKLPIDCDALPPMVKNRHSIFTGEPAAAFPHLDRPTEQKPSRPIVHKMTQEDAEESERKAEAVLTPAKPMTGPVADLMSFDPNVMMPSMDVLGSATLRDLEMRAIESALARHNGNKSKAAEELGISLKTLYNKLSQTEKRSA